MQIIICKVYSASGEGSIDPDPCLASPGAHAPVLADKPGGSHSRTRQRIVKYKQTTKIYSDFAKWQNRQSVTDLWLTELFFGFMKTIGEREMYIQCN